MFARDADDEPAWIHRCRILRLERAAQGLDSYRVFVDADTIGWVRQVHLQDWEYQSLEGTVAAGFASARSAANRLLDALDGYEPAPPQPVEIIG